MADNNSAMQFLMAMMQMQQQKQQHAAMADIEWEKVGLQRDISQYTSKLTQAQTTGLSQQSGYQKDLVEGYRWMAEMAPKLGVETKKGDFTYSKGKLKKYLQKYGSIEVDGETLGLDQMPLARIEREVDRRFHQKVGIIKAASALNMMQGGQGLAIPIGQQDEFNNLLTKLSTVLTGAGIAGRHPGGTASVLSKLPMIGGRITKERVGKLGAKQVPVLGGLFNLAAGGQRLARGDYTGAGIEGAAAVADFATPAVPPLVYLAALLDAISLGRDVIQER